MKNIAKVIAMIAAVFCVTLAIPGSAKAADDTQVTRHYFTKTTSTQKITYFVEGEKVVAVSTFSGRNLDYSKYYYEMKNDYTGIHFYRLNSAGTGVEKVPFYTAKVYTLQDGEWVLTYDGSETGYTSSFSDITYSSEYYDFTDSGIDILEFNMNDRGTVFNKGTMSMEYKSESHSTMSNIYSYLLNGTFTDFGKNYVFLLHENTLDIVPEMYRRSYSSLENSSVSISVDYDEENGIVSWSDFVVDEENTLKKGVIAGFYYSGDKASGTDYYRTILTGTSYKISLGGCDFSDSTMRYKQIQLIPYYIHTNGTLYFGKCSYFDIDADSVAATRSASSLLTQVSTGDDSPSGVFPDKGGQTRLPDFSVSQSNNAFSLKNFSASISTLRSLKFLKVSWDGISHALSDLEDDVNNYEHTFVRVQFAYALNDNVSDIIQTVDYEKCYKFSDNGFLIQWDSIQSSNESAYLKYVKVTPYYRNLDMSTARLYEGKSSFVYFDPYGDLSHTSLSDVEDQGGSGSIREGTRYLSDLYLSGVSVDSTLTGNKYVKWKGTTSSATSVVPDSDTMVIATYCVYTDTSGGVSVRQYKTVTIGAYKMHIDIASILSDCEKEGVLWDNEIRLTPCYRSNGILYIGEQTVIDIYDGTITNVGDSGSGSISSDPVSSGDSGVIPSGSSWLDFGNMGKFTDYLNYAVSFLCSVVSAMGSFPSLLAAVFSFLPSFFVDFLVVVFIILVFLRILAR